MAARRARLTDRRIADLTGERSAYVLWDEGSPLGVRVTPRGVKSWVITYRQGGRSRRLALGRVGTLPLVAARRLAAQKHTEIAQGVDPLQEKRQKALTVAEAAKI